MISFTMDIALRSTLLKYEYFTELDQHKYLLSNLTTSLPQSLRFPSPLLTAATVLHFSILKHLKLAPYNTALPSTQIEDRTHEEFKIY